jgi:hypothetical protein
MTGLRKTTTILWAFAMVSLVAGSALAGLLDTGTPYYDGTKSWKGTTPFDSGDDLIGTVDWAVFGPGQFPFSGYEPTSGSFTYVYQLHNTGTAAITAFTVALENYAGNIGSFSDLVHGVTGVATTEEMLSLDGGAVWSFSGISTSDSSCGLVFSSSYTPMDYIGVTVNHGQFAFTDPVPAPSASPIPEPGAIWLLASGLGLVLAARWFRRR